MKKILYAMESTESTPSLIMIFRVFAMESMESTPSLVMIFRVFVRNQRLVWSWFLVIKKEVCVGCCRNSLVVELLTGWKYWLNDNQLKKKKLTEESACNQLKVRCKLLSFHLFLSSIDWIRGRGYLYFEIIEGTFNPIILFLFIRLSRLIKNHLSCLSLAYERIEWIGLNSKKKQLISSFCYFDNCSIMAIFYFFYFWRPDDMILLRTNPHLI